MAKYDYKIMNKKSGEEYYINKNRRVYGLTTGSYKGNFSEGGFIKLIKGIHESWTCKAIRPMYMENK